MKNIKNLPQHIVAIPDGNRRWARQKNLHSWLGHKAGAKNLEKILAVVRDMNLPCFSFWGASRDNITKRPDQEVKFLLELFRSYFAKLIKRKDIYRMDIRVNIFGAWPELFPTRIKKPMTALIEATKNHSSRTLNFFIAYDGKDEMVRATKAVVQQAKKKKGLKITSQLIKANLWTKDLPPVDLVIRTGVQNDPHLSAGFMMWDCADAQLYFTKILWPDFGPKEFTKVIKDFSKKERRFGQ